MYSCLHIFIWTCCISDLNSNKTTMKKLPILAVLALILTSCWSTTTDSNTKAYSWSGFTMNVPSAWINVEKQALPQIQNWNIELALTSTDIKAWFANNLVVLSESVQEWTTSVKYSIVNYVRATWAVKQYTKTDDIDFKFQDNDEGKMYVFDAKYTDATPMRKFIQTAKVCWKKAYLMTIGLNIDNTTVTKYEDLLKSFACKTN